MTQIAYKNGGGHQRQQAKKKSNLINLSRSEMKYNNVSVSIIVCLYLAHSVLVSGANHMTTIETLLSGRVALVDPQHAFAGAAVTR